MTVILLVQEIRKFLQFLILISLAILLMRCSNQSEGSKQTNDELIPAVEAVQARYGSLPLTERLTGVIKALNQIEIYPELNAVVVNVYVKDGDYVKQGQLLVQLRDKEFYERLKQAKASHQIAVAQAKQAQARLTEMQANLNRTRSLAENGLISMEELESIQTRTIAAEADLELANARVAQAQANIDERQETLSQTSIRAPISGSVGNRNAEVGMLVNSNTRLFTLGQLDNLKVEVILTDLMLNYIEVGQRAEIYLPNLSATSLTAPLSRISPFLHPVTHSTEAEIDLANPDGKLMPGMFVPVDVYYGESQQATLVPLSALYENPATGETGVYVSQESLKREPVSKINTSLGAGLSDPISFKFVPVDIIARGRMKVAITGVEPSSWVVSLGQDLLGGVSNRARVRTVNWDWVNKLQNLQRQDLLEEIMHKQQAVAQDTQMIELQDTKKQ